MLKLRIIFQFIEKKTVFKRSINKSRHLYTFVEKTVQIIYYLDMVIKRFQALLTDIWASGVGRDCPSLLNSTAFP